MTGVRLLNAAAVLLSACFAASGQVVPPPPPPPPPPVDSPDGALSIRVDPDPVQLNPILEDLRANKPKLATEKANELLRSYPDSVWLNCAAGEAAVAAGDQLSLHLVLDRLKKLASPNEPCVSKLGSQYGRMADTAGLRMRALELVKGGKLDEARKVVASAHLEPRENLVIEHYLDRAQTRFTNAMSRLQTLKRTIPSAATEADTLLDETRQQAKEFTSLRERERTYLFDPVATSSCAPKDASDMFRQKGMSLEEFLSGARSLVREYPSHPDVQQFYFMALVLAGTDQSLRKYGNSVLERFGKLSIPFFSRDHLYLLVIDRYQERLSLKEYSGNNLGHTDGLREAVTFDLPYSEVASLHQTVSSDLPTRSLSAKSAALDFGPQGLAPYYSLMSMVHCMYGEKYQRRATERLGKFVATELDLAPEKIKLVNPDSETKDVFGEFLSTVTIVTEAASQVAIQHQEKIAINKPQVNDTLVWQQMQANQVQEDGDAILQLQQQAAAEREDQNGWQIAGEISLEQELTERGFNEAFDLDVPGYVQVLAGMLKKRN
jgi:hypothetical protein